MIAASSTRLAALTAGRSSTRTSPAITSTCAFSRLSTRPRSRRSTSSLRLAIVTSGYHECPGAGARALQPERARPPSSSRLTLGLVAPEIDRLAGAREQQRPPQAANGGGVNHALLDVAAGRYLVHDVQQAVLKDRAEAAGAGLVLQRLLRRRLQGVG